jgi:hypothetical protein
MTGHDRKDVDLQRAVRHRYRRSTRQ